MSQVLNNRCWVADIWGALTVQALVEYVLIWDLVDSMVLHLDVPLTATKSCCCQWDLVDGMVLPLVFTAAAQRIQQ